MDSPGKIAELQKQIDDLKLLIQGLSNPGSVSPDVILTLQTKLLKISNKSATSESKTVNEGGGDSYGVLNNPDGFIELSNGKYIPYFN